MNDMIDKYTNDHYAPVLCRLRNSGHSDIANILIRGEISIEAAYKKAGFRERQVRIPFDPKRAAALVVKHFSEQQARKFAASILARITPEPF